MGSENGQTGYRVTLLARASRQLRRLADEAGRRGVARVSAVDLEGIDRRLHRRPSEWGDPLFDYHQRH
jgi:short-subunit dehydrogenase